MKTEDVQKQRAHVANKRNASTKFVKRGVRRRMNVIEKVTVNLVNELRQYLKAQSDQNDATNIVVRLLIRAALDEALTDEEKEVFSEYLTATQPEAPVDGPAASTDASAGG